MSPAKRAKLLHDIYHRMYAHFGPRHWWPSDAAFEMMVGAMLVQNTAWTNVQKAIAQLKDRGLLDPHLLHQLGPEKIAPFIKSAGYFRVKARRLWHLIDWFVTRHGATLRSMQALPTAELRAELLSVHGVGKETADSILLYALNRPIFVIDAYTRRIFARHGISPADATYDHLQTLAHKHLPPDPQLYNEYHALLVNVGKHHCKPTPRCQSCPLQPLLPRNSPYRTVNLTISHPKQRRAQSAASSPSR